MKRVKHTTTLKPEIKNYLTKWNEAHAEETGIKSNILIERLIENYMIDTAGMELPPLPASKGQTNER